MEKFPINRRRLEWCRKNYHIKLDDMAARAGIKPALLQRAWRGEEVLTDQQLWDLGRALDLEMSFFMDPGDVSKQEMRSPQFRAAACRPQPNTETMMLLGRVERHRSYFEGLLEISPRPKARKVRYPRLRPGYAGKARAVRKWLGISGPAGFAELRERVEAKGIMVFVSSGWGRWKIPAAGDKEQFKGFVLRHESLPVIFVAKELDERDQSFTLMHELAHLILHKGDAIDGEQSLDALHRENKQELEANTLAGYILLSEEARQAADGLRLAGQEPRKAGKALQRLCDKHGISMAGVLAYLVDSKRASVADARDCLNWSLKQNGKKARRQDNAADPAEEIWSVLGSRYVNEALDAEASKEITLFKALVYLDIDLKTFQNVSKKKTP